MSNVQDTLDGIRAQLRTCRDPDTIAVLARLAVELYNDINHAKPIKGWQVMESAQ